MDLPDPESDYYDLNASNLDIGDGSLAINALLRPKEKNQILEIVFMILYSIIALLSLTGNLIVLIIVIRRRRMRIVTNFFLANITISSLIYTGCAPLHFINDYVDEWIYFDNMCQLLPFLSTISINVNTFTMIAASFERLVSIVFPFKTKLSKHKCIIIIALIWLASMIASLPWIFVLQVKYINIFRMGRIELSNLSKSGFSENHLNFDLETNEPLKLDLKENQNDSFKRTEIIYKILSNKDFKESDFATYLDNMDKNSTKEIIEIKKIASEPSNASLEIFGDGTSKNQKNIITFIERISNVRECDSVYQNPMIIRTYFLILCIIQYLLPMLVLCITYVIIACYCYFINSKIDANINTNIFKKNKKNLVKMLMIIILCFNICWFPMQLNAFLYAISPEFVASLM